MFRSMLIAAALIGVSAPAVAQSVSATPGALAGRSPHTAFKTADADDSRCGKTMHSLPAGKPHTYGANAMPAKPCLPVELASNGTVTPVAND